MEKYKAQCHGRRRAGISQAVNARDSVCKVMYNRLFQWLVYRANVSLGTSNLGGSDEGGGKFFIGVLDIAGFEFFAENSIEQLWINLSNEKLQQFFNNAVFKSEIAEYEAEGIPLDSIAFRDNQIILDLLEGKGGVADPRRCHLGR